MPTSEMQPIWRLRQNFQHYVANQNSNNADLALYRNLLYSSIHDEQLPSENMNSKFPRFTKYDDQMENNNLLLDYLENELYAFLPYGGGHDINIAQSSLRRKLASEECSSGWGIAQVTVAIILGAVALLSMSLAIFIHRTRKHQGRAKVLELATRNRELEAYVGPSEGHAALIAREMAALATTEQELLHGVEIDGSRLEVGAVVGMGSYAEVRRGTYRGTPVAVKTLKTVDERALQRFRAEILLMKDLRHPNIVMLIGASWSTGRLMMVVELFDRGNLADVLETVQLTWKQKFCMLEDIARGMAYLHSARYFDESTKSYRNCVIHRDLKPQNMLVTPNLRIKITDFGEARAIDNDYTMTQVGTLLYIAPEIVRGDKYDEKCDVYSFSVVLLGMLQVRKHIFDLFVNALRELRASGTQSSTPEVGLVGDIGGKAARITPHMVTVAIVNEDLRPTLPEGVPPSLALLIEQSWDSEATNRPTFKEILEYIDTIVKEEIGDLDEMFPFIPKNISKLPTHVNEPDVLSDGFDSDSAFSDPSVDDSDSDGDESESSRRVSLTAKESDALAEKILARVRGMQNPAETEFQEQVERRRAKEQNEIDALKEEMANRRMRREEAELSIEPKQRRNSDSKAARRPQGYRAVYGALAIDNLTSKNPELRKQLLALRQREGNEVETLDEEELLLSKDMNELNINRSSFESNTYDEEIHSCILEKKTLVQLNIVPAQSPDRVWEGHRNLSIVSTLTPGDLHSPFPDSPPLLHIEAKSKQETMALPRPSVQMGVMKKEDKPSRQTSKALSYLLTGPRPAGGGVVRPPLWTGVVDSSETFQESMLAHPVVSMTSVQEEEVLRFERGKISPVSESDDGRQTASAHLWDRQYSNEISKEVIECQELKSNVGGLPQPCLRSKQSYQDSFLKVYDHSNLNETIGNDEDDDDDDGMYNQRLAELMKFRGVARK